MYVVYPFSSYVGSVTDASYTCSCSASSPLSEDREPEESEESSPALSEDAESLPEDAESLPALSEDAEDEPLAVSSPAARTRTADRHRKA